MKQLFYEKWRPEKILEIENKKFDFQGDQTLVTSQNGETLCFQQFQKPVRSQ